LRGLFLHGFRGSVAHGVVSFVGLAHPRNVRFPGGVRLLSPTPGAKASAKNFRPRINANAELIIRPLICAKRR
jgi:hypothetical protein